MEKLLVTSDFSFCHNVFHSYISLVRQNAVLCGNGLTYDEILAISILKANTNKFIVTKYMKLVVHRVENIEEKREKCW